MELNALGLGFLISSQECVLLITSSNAVAVSQEVQTPVCTELREREGDVSRWC